MIVTSTGGSILGKGGSRIVVDDPHQPDESDTQREAVLWFFTQTLSTRLDNKNTGAIVVVMQRLHERGLTLPQDGAVFDPRGMDVGQVQRVQEVSVRAVARVAHQVHLSEARFGDVPVVGLDRNVVLQQGARLGTAIDAAPHRPFVGREQAIDLARADGADLRFGPGR